MKRDPRMYLWEAREAADNIASFLRGRTLDDYLREVMLRSAVERQFEIIGEALNQLSKLERLQRAFPIRRVQSGFAIG